MPVWRKQDEGLSIERKATNLHRKLTLEIVKNLGFESNFEELSPAQKYERIKKVLETLNHRMGLGWENFDIEGMALSDVGLATNAKRWAKQSKIDVRHGENSLVHSLHALVDTLRFYDASISPEEKEGFAFRKLCVQVARGVKEHDRDEQCGEDFTVDAAARVNVHKDEHAANVQQEPLKARFVRTNNRMVAVAVETRNFDAYFNALDEFTRNYDLKSTGAGPLQVFIDQHAGVMPSTEAGLKFCDETTAQYLLAEGLLANMTKQQKFLQSLIKGIENSQGSRHAYRFAKLVPDPDHPGRRIYGNETNATILGQIDYIDRTPGKLMAYAQGTLETAVARTTVASMYEALGKILALMPKYVQFNEDYAEPSQVALMQKHTEAKKKYLEDDSRARRMRIGLVLTDENDPLKKQIKRVLADPDNVDKQNRLLELAARREELKDDRQITRKTLSVEDVDYLSKLYLQTATLVKNGKFVPKEGQKLPALDSQPSRTARG